ncbi:ICE2-domain-containing protein, partial [Metschnikowia bicuspidata var. bicuspidata NRRL YB-4993]
RDMRQIKHYIKSVLSFTYLALVVLTIPLAFDVGGVPCGLAYSLFIMLLHFLLTTVRLLSHKFPVLAVFNGFFYAQHLLLPSILMFFLLYCAEKDVAEVPVIFLWRYLLVHLTLVFTVAEGFCSLLLIQAISQTLEWLTDYKSDSWLFVSLIGSGTTITGALYFLYRIYISPFTLDLGNASLLGLFLTLTVGLGLYGIVSKKGLMIESSLIFAYIVRCIYETFPLLSQDATQTITFLFTQTTNNLKKELVKLPYPVAEKILSALPVFASNIPHSFTTIYKFFISAVQKLTLPVLINLAYRIGVFYAATKIIPSVYHGLPYSPPRTPQIRSRQVSSSSIPSIHLADKDSEARRDLLPTRAAHHPKRDPPSTIIKLIYAYSPCIIIAVYTHLMLLYKGELGNELKLWGWWAGASEDSVFTVHPWQFWNWINMATTLFLYMAELAGNTGSTNSAMTSHWKVD